jgi:Nucleotidyltransferase domain
LASGTVRAKVPPSDDRSYIRPEANLANVQPEYQGVPDAAAGLLADEFGSHLHSAYLYGSVVRGNAVPGRSDVDLVADGVGRRAGQAWI